MIQYINTFVTSRRHCEHLMGGTLIKTTCYESNLANSISDRLQASDPNVRRN